MAPELGCPGCLIRGSAGLSRQPLENLRSGTTTPNCTSRIRFKKTDDFSPRTLLLRYTQTRDSRSTFVTKLAKVRMHAPLKLSQQRGTRQGESTRVRTYLCERPCVYMAIQGMLDPFWGHSLILALLRGL